MSTIRLMIGNCTIIRTSVILIPFISEYWWIPRSLSTVSAISTSSRKGTIKYYINAVQSILNIERARYRHKGRLTTKGILCDRGCEREGVELKDKDGEVLSAAPRRQFRSAALCLWLAVEASAQCSAVQWNQLILTLCQAAGVRCLYRCHLFVLNNVYGLFGFTSRGCDALLL